jgi:DNA-binding NarL/FixJ family response regulator
MFRCLLVEDHLMFMQFISAMLRGMRHLEVVGQARTLEEGSQLCAEHRPDLLLLDIALPDGNGLEVGRQLITLNPEARIIVLTGEMATFVCPAELKPYIYDVIEKSGAFEELEQAIKQFIQEHMRAQKEREAPGIDAQKKRALSKRENEVFRLIGAGLISKEIAGELGLSAHTVNVFRKRIAGKMGISGHEMTREAIRQHQATMGR